MRSAVIEQRSSYRPGGSRRTRAGAATLALAVTALVLWMLLRMGMIPPGLTRAVTPLTMELLPAPPVSSGNHTSRVATSNKGGAPARRAQAQPHVAPPPPPPVPAPAWNVIPLTSQEMTSADIASMPSQRPAASQGGGGNGTGHASGDGNGSGEGPGGAELYNADWERRPSNAELDTYMPAHHIDGWGEVACRTIAHFQVEDCRELGESPAGSGLARAVREAAWQFRIRPPRVDGQSLVGAWVRIRIDYTEVKAP